MALALLLAWSSVGHAQDIATALPVSYLQKLMDLSDQNGEVGAIYKASCNTNQASACQTQARACQNICGTNKDRDCSYCMQQYKACKESAGCS